MVDAELFLVPELRDDHVRGPEHEGAMEHVRVVLTPVLKLREIDRSGKAFGDVTEVLEQVLELAELAHRAFTGTSQSSLRSYTTVWRVVAKIGRGLSGLSASALSMCVL